MLVVDDEPGIVSAIAYALRREGYEVDTAADGQEALDKVLTFRPNAMVLDVMMPKLSGYDVCRRLENRKDIGIILLTVKNDIVDKIVGLELGADDYMTKPFEIRELLARVKALLRRLDKQGGETPGEIIEYGALRVYPGRRSAELDGQQLELTPKEFDLLLPPAVPPAACLYARRAAGTGMGNGLCRRYTYGGHPHPAAAQKAGRAVPECAANRLWDRL